MTYNINIDSAIHMLSVNCLIHLTLDTFFMRQFENATSQKKNQYQKQARCATTYACFSLCLPLIIITPLNLFLALEIIEC